MSRPRGKQRFGSLLVLVLSLPIAGVLLYAIASSVATHRMATVRDAWEASFGSPEEFLARFPARQANEAALRLEELTARVGVELATRGYDRVRPSQAQARRFKDVQIALGDYLTAQVERPHAGVERPPAALSAYLAAHAEPLRAVRRQLVDGPAPRWELELERMFAAPIPNLLGHINLHKLLLGAALASAANGDSAEARDGLEASWRLNGSIRDDPVLITQLIGISAARLQAGAVRQLAGLSPEIWRERLAEHDFRASMIRALQFEGIVWSRLDDPSLYGVWSDPWPRLTYTVTRPYARMCIADLSDDWRRRVSNLAKLEYLCDRDLAKHGADLSLSFPWWNRIGPLVAPDLVDALDRIGRLELDLELTRRLLALRAAGAAPGATRRALRRSEASEACPEDEWLLELSPSGEASIALSREIEWADRRGAVLPTRFRWTTREN